jgi:hypothetical protein
VLQESKFDIYGRYPVDFHGKTKMEGLEYWSNSIVDLGFWIVEFNNDIDLI